MAGVVLYTDQSSTVGETCPNDELLNFDFDEIGVQCTSEYIRYNAHVSGKAGTLGGTRLGTWCHRQLHEQDIWSHAEAENTCMCGDKTGVINRHFNIEV